VLSKTKNPQYQFFLADGMKAACGGLRSGAAPEQTVRAALALASARRKTRDVNALQRLAPVFPAVAGSLSTADLAGLLCHPQCGDEQRVLLDVLGARCKREFRGPWYFVEWADNNGVELIAREGAD
jgi:hypothetical protein